MRSAGDVIAFEDWQILQVPLRLPSIKLAFFQPFEPLLSLLVRFWFFAFQNFINPGDRALRSPFEFGADLVVTCYPGKRFQGFQPPWPRSQ
jgi:hypothetical protein